APISQQASTRNQATHGSCITDQLANFNQKQGNSVTDQSASSTWNLAAPGSSVTDQSASLNQEPGDTWQQHHRSVG
ncbi:MAG: hypothetical protein MSB00_03855, partial [Prevotella sp.]|nr:hypothetical protein [Prevotella sp.]